MPKRATTPPPPAPALTVESVPLEDLVPDPDNPREISPAEAAKLRAAMERFGLVLPVVANRRDRRIIGGHQRAALAADLGLDAVPVVWLDLDDDEARTLNLALNRIAGTWDLDALGAVLATLDNGARQLAGFDPDELAAFDLAELAPEDDEHEVRFTATRGRSPETPRPPDHPETEPGDVWQLGEHRVVCADTWDLDVAATLGESPDIVATDPPFAIFGSSTGVASDVTDDRMVRPFFERIARRLVAELPAGAHVYVHCDWRSWAALWDGFRRGGLAVRNMIVWHKTDGAGQGSNYANTHELVAFCHNRPNLGTFGERKAQPGYRAVNAPNVIGANRVRGKARKHNAAKPVDLLEFLLEQSTDPGGLVWDPFAGSGSTLIAAENIGRRCVAVEMEPAWVDVIVQRWRDLTGKKGRRLKGRAVLLDNPAEAQHGDGADPASA